MKLSEGNVMDTMIAGGSAGTLADAALHCLDTIKTRQQGQLASKSTKYSGLANSTQIILKEEGIRGFFGGFTASIVGSMLSTTLYFGVYDTTKRNLKQLGINPTLSYFLSGIFALSGGIADVVASALYVPSEVLKTRLQLQGRYNNPNSLSAHNYKNTLDALRTIYRKRGMNGLYYGWGATLLRDVPYSAVQFTIYESLKELLQKRYYPPGQYKLSSGHDMLSGATAGAFAGAVTTPLDVIKTYLQTQKRRPKASMFLNTEEDILRAPTYNGMWSAFKGIYKQQGIRGLFAGVGVRMTWTGSQSMVMFFLYELFMDTLK